MVKVGVTLKMYDHVSYRPKRLVEMAAQARRAEEQGLDSAWVMDHLLIDRPTGRVHTHDPILSIAAAAMATSRITLGSLVLCHAFRPIGQLAREAAALADLTDGRFVLGLGAGWHRPEFDAFGLPLDHRVSRLEEALDPMMRLMGGECVSAGGRWLTLSNASVAATADRPPVWIAGAGSRMLRLAGQRADGWNHSYWGGADPRAFAEALDRLRDGMNASGRDPSEVTVSASVACVLGEWRQIPGAFREPEVATGPPQHIAEVVAGYAEAGAEHVILSLSPDPFAELDPGQLEAAGRIVDLLRSWGLSLQRA